MRKALMALFTLAISASSLANPTVAQSQAANGATVPKLQFDKLGRLILVVTPDGHSCVYQYGEGGSLISPKDNTCGDPQAWLKTN